MFLNLLAISLYILLSARLWWRLKSKQADHWLFWLVVAVAIVAHAIGLESVIVSNYGYALGFAPMASMVALTVTLIVLISHNRNPTYLLMAALFPINIVTIALSMSLSTYIKTDLPFEIFLHIVLSITAYSLIALAMMQSMLLVWQNYHLKNPKSKPPPRRLPAIQTMESLLIDLILSGELVLTLSIISGIVYIDNIFAQDLIHKTVLSITSWIVFAILLIGRRQRGWRGNTLVKWVLLGFSLLMLAFFGSQLVLEFILDKA